MVMGVHLRKGRRRGSVVLDLFAVGDFAVVKGYPAALMLTAYHAKFFAHELTKRCPSDSIEKLAGALVDAQVDLNPHQVEVALFAFRPPLSKGAFWQPKLGSERRSKLGWW